MKLFGTVYLFVIYCATIHHVSLRKIQCLKIILELSYENNLFVDFASHDKILTYEPSKSYRSTIFHVQIWKFCL